MSLIDRALSAVRTKEERELAERDHARETNLATAIAYAEKILEQKIDYSNVSHGEPEAREYVYPDMRLTLDGLVFELNADRVYLLDKPDEEIGYNQGRHEVYNLTELGEMLRQRSAVLDQ